MIYGEIIDARSMANAGVIDVDLAELAETAFRAATGPADEACIERVNGMKEEYGAGVSALVTIYNALGCNLHYRTHRDFHGHLFKYSPDSVIHNGQWSCFLHTKTAGAARGSCGVVVYDLKGGYEETEQLLLLVSWSIPWSGANSVSAYVMSDGSYAKTSWAKIEEWAEEDAKLVRHWDHGPLRVQGKTTQETSPIVRVIASRKELF